MVVKETVAKSVQPFCIAIESDASVSQFLHNFP